MSVLLVYLLSFSCRADGMEDGTRVLAVWEWELLTR